ncbi:MULTISPECIES: DUF1056 family protein [Levilactobacillus]|uniref:DUF1056 family protein n=1 Tax=Levilactobacillus TaxID=2767886 RepID=UPI0021A4C670|nr:DUF1056 family protein [Levilactobacillus parabrevis]MCT4489369.1 DUF1056 family protein [Levilactobacillus parabrevis]
MTTTIFKRILSGFWNYFDVICFVIALGLGDYGAFLMGKAWGVFALALTAAVIGWLSEVIAANNQKGGD